MKGLILAGSPSFKQSDAHSFEKFDTIPVLILLAFFPIWWPTLRSMNQWVLHSGLHVNRNT